MRTDITYPLHDHILSRHGTTGVIRVIALIISVEEIQRYEITFKIRKHAHSTLNQHCFKFGCASKSLNKSGMCKYFI